MDDNLSMPYRDSAEHYRNNFVDFPDIILIYIERGLDDDVVKLFIESSQIHNFSDSRGSTLLHYCAQWGNRNITKHLLDRNCLVDPQDRSGNTPLINALKYNQERIIKILLKAGANVIGLNKENKSALHYLAEYNRFSSKVYRLFFQKLKEKCSNEEEAANKMIDAGCDIYHAACLNNTAVIKRMLEEGFSSNSMHWRNKRTALHLAVGFSNVKAVQLLLEYNADVNAVDINNANSLIYFDPTENREISEQVKILQMLLNSGISLTTCTTRGFFQIHYVLCAGSCKIIRMILSSNIDFAAKDANYRRVILHYLVMNKNAGVAEELKHFLSKFKLNPVDQNKMTPLSIAVRRYNVDMVKMLLQAGADCNCLLEESYPPLYHTYTKNPDVVDANSEILYEQCIELLLQYKADPQFVITKDTGEQVTIFDVASEANTLHRIKPIICRLAMLEALGTPITEITLSRIDSHQDVKNYFSKCKRLLRRKVFGSVKVLKLLTSNKKKIAACLNSKESFLKLKRLGYNTKAISFSSSYYNILRKKLPNAMHYKRFRIEAFDIIGRVLQNHLPKTHIFVYELVDYFDSQDLHPDLHKIGKKSQ